MWKVRRVTQRTHRLPMAGAAHVDRELARVLHSCSFAQIERAADAAAAEADDEHEDLQRLAQPTWVNLDWRAAPHCHGKVPLDGFLDLAEEIAVDRYRPSEEQREQAILTTPTCVFPDCHKAARPSDLEHFVPWRDDGTGGQTASWNLAPLCRLHHRMKTHGNWTYTRLSRTSFEWTAPDGRTYDVDLTHKRRRTR